MAADAGDVGRLVERLRGGDGRAVARLISLVEDGVRERLREVAEALNPSSGKAQVIGLTGAPGVGKSTMCDALVGAFRAAGHSVGVLAVDPTSPFTGGALLGDRVRMQRHALDQGVYIRSMATRGHLGGLAWATPQAVRVLDAAGCEVILVETVGVGQAEVEVAGLADRSVPVLLTVAERGEGIDELVAGIASHRAHLEESGELERRRRRRAAREVEEIALADLRAELGELGHGEALDTLAEQVVAGKLGPYAAADQLLGQVRR